MLIYIFFLIFHAFSHIIQYFTMKTRNVNIGLTITLNDKKRMCYDLSTDYWFLAPLRNFGSTCPSRLFQPWLSGLCCALKRRKQILSQTKGLKQPSHVSVSQHGEGRMVHSSQFLRNPDYWGSYRLKAIDVRVRQEVDSLVLVIRCFTLEVSPCLSQLIGQNQSHGETKQWGSLCVAKRISPSLTKICKSLEIKENSCKSKV